MKSFSLLLFALALNLTFNTAAQAKDRDAYAAYALTQQILVESTKIESPELASDELLLKFTNETKECSFSLSSGPTCLNSSFQQVYGSFGNDSYIESSDSFIFFSIIREGKNKNPTFYGLVVEVSKDTHAKKFKQIFASIVSSKTTATLLKNDYLLGKVKAAVTITSPKDELSAATKELSNTYLYRSVYHLSQLLLKSKDGQDTVLNELPKKYSLITESDSDEYKIALLQLVREKLSTKADLLANIANALIESKKAEIAQLSAITLAEQGNTDSKIKNLVINALSNSGWSMRRLAVNALNNIKSTSEDQNLIFGMMLDSDSDVANAAVAIVNNFPLTNANLPFLTQMSHHNSWEVRRTGINLISKIKTPEATAIILERYNDSFSDVRTAAVAIMTNRGFTEAEIPQLIQLARAGGDASQIIVIQALGKFKTDEVLNTLIGLLNDSGWEVREAAVYEVELNPSSVATKALICKMGDSDSDVANAATAAVNKRKLSNTELPEFQKLLSNNDWGTRKKGINSIKTIDTTEATLAIIPLITDSDSDVREAAMSALNGRKMGEETEKELIKLSTSGRAEGRMNVITLISKNLSPTVIETLIKMTKDSEWTIRLAAVNAIAKTLEENVTARLIDMIPESDSEVKNAVSTALKGRTFTDSHINQLGNHLNNNDWGRRREAANYLGTTSSQKALDLLRDRLDIETDSDVQVALRQAIKDVKARLGK
ncbi:MAG: HEAT repeat domain-containing protein [Xanthomonadaceae bacterium]|nr:HEAT repeat domain-containing protein [Xanthomonadaceae bacterium]